MLKLNTLGRYEMIKLDHIDDYYKVQVEVSGKIGLRYASETVLYTNADMLADEFKDYFDNYPTFLFTSLAEGVSPYKVTVTPPKNKVVITTLMKINMDVCKTTIEKVLNG